MMRKVNQAPTPEQMTAFLDGELDAPTRAWVADWLAQHPEAAAEVECWRRLDRLWQASAPAEPTEAAWAGMLVRIRSTTFSRDPKGSAGSVRTLRRRGWLAAAAVAAVLLAVLLFRSQTAPPPPGPAPIERYPVAKAGDVEIISMDAADIRALVVGEFPMLEPLVLAEPGDVTLHKIAPDDDGMIPQLLVPEGADTPMIVAPLAESPRESR